MFLPPLQATLCWCLHSLSLEAATSPLANFGLSPPAWAPPLGWCLALLPCSPLILGAAVHLIWGGRPLPRYSVTIVSLWHSLTLVLLPNNGPKVHNKVCT